MSIDLAILDPRFHYLKQPTKYNKTEFEPDLNCNPDLWSVPDRARVNPPILPNIWCLKAQAGVRSIIENSGPGRSIRERVRKFQIAKATDCRENFHCPARLVWLSSNVRFLALMKCTWRKIVMNTQSIPTDNLKIGVVGLGRMGSVISQRLASQGFQVSGWTRSGVCSQKAIE